MAPHRFLSFITSELLYLFKTMVTFCFHHESKFRVGFLLNWLPPKAKDPSISFYLTHRLEEMNSCFLINIAKIATATTYTMIVRISIIAIKPYNTTSYTYRKHNYYSHQGQGLKKGVKCSKY